MNAQEAAKVLALASTYDFRLSPPSDTDAIVRAEAWALTFAYDLTPEFALQAVVDHYSQTEKSITPSTINAAWRTHKRKAGEKRIRQEREAELDQPSVPMPAEVRARLDEIFARPRRVETD